MTLKSFGKKLFPLITIAFIALVGYFLFEAFSKIDWQEVGMALNRVSLEVLLSMVALVALNYTILTSYDYMGFRYLRKSPLPYRIVAPTALVCYAFNFNLGALIGGLGFRVRIYSGWKASKKRIPFVALFTVVTTWIGYTFLLSLICVLFPSWLDGPFQFPAWAIRTVGVLGSALVVWYFFLCNKGYQLKLKGRYFNFPRPSTAAAQVALSSAQWCIAASIIFFFLRHLGAELFWGKVILTFLIASIGGVIARIPAGIGVLEAIFLKMQPQIPATDLLAALLCFRAVYFILPLALAVPGYIFIEYIQKRKPRNSGHNRQNSLAAR